jgi:Zn-dependent peptidase ImmA (M78 family)
MKKIPKSVTIFGRKYKLKIVSQQKIIQIAGSLCEACVEFDSKSIFVVKDLPDDEKLIAILHEIQHISHHTCGISQVISPEMQEILCESTAQAFYDLLRSLNGLK